MIQGLVKAAVRGAVQDAASRAAGAGLMLFAALIMVLAAGFGFFAAYLGLATVLPPWAAALIVALVIALIGMLTALAGRSMVQRKRRSGAAFEQQLGALSAQAREAGEKAVHDNALPLVIGAALVGIILGQHLKK